MYTSSEINEEIKGENFVYIVKELKNEQRKIENIEYGHMNHFMINQFMSFYGVRENKLKF